MNIKWHSHNPGPHINRGNATFAAPALAKYSCPIIDIVGNAIGPRLCVMAGIHINEASSIEVAVSLAEHIDSRQLRGTVSIIPVVSTHNLYKYTFVTAPTEGRDLHWSYPGRSDGSFNEALAHALIFDWAKDAAVLLDLHGGDLDERMARYVVIQSTNDAAYDTQAAALAECFDTELVVALRADPGEEPGRCCTALARNRRLALVAEAGDQGTTDPSSVDWMRNAVVNVARHLSMIDGQVQRRTPQVVLDRYEWITAPSGGIIDREFGPGQWVRAGQRIGVVRDLFGCELEAIHAPESGCVMMQKTTQFAPAGYWIGSIGVPRTP
jgi:predicted deacylase